MSVSDLELIGRVKTLDDRDAFRDLVLRHQSAVRQFLRHLSKGDAALADDLAQETFVQAYRSLAHFRGEAKFSTWLLGIAHNHWRNVRRREHRRAQTPETSTNVQPTAASDDSDMRQDLAVALRQLTADEQLAVHLGYYQGHSHAEIATLLDWPLGTVKTHLARGKEKLRHLLAAWNPRT